MNRFFSIYLIYLLITVNIYGITPPNKPQLKLYVFDCGRLKFDNINSFGINNHEINVRELVVPCYIIEHEKGRLLWEGGLPSYVADSPDWVEMETGSKMRLDKTLKLGFSQITNKKRVFWDYSSAL